MENSLHLLDQVLFANAAGIIKGRLERRYLRLCRIQQELENLNLKKNQEDSSLEDFVFSKIDFSRYKEISFKLFSEFYIEGITDFDESFFEKNFDRSRTQIKIMLKASYRKTDECFMLHRDNPVIISVMRTLDTSLEDNPLFTPAEINAEQKKHLLRILDNTVFSHDDGKKTKLFVSPNGDLSGTFQPGGKPWTRVLIPAHLPLN